MAGNVRRATGSRSRDCVSSEHERLITAQNQAAPVCTGPGTLAELASQRERFLEPDAPLGRLAASFSGQLRPAAGRARRLTTAGSAASGREQFLHVLDRLILAQARVTTSTFPSARSRLPTATRTGIRCRSASLGARAASQLITTDTPRPAYTDSAAPWATSVRPDKDDGHLERRHRPLGRSRRDTASAMAATAARSTPMPMAGLNRNNSCIPAEYRHPQCSRPAQLEDVPDLDSLHQLQRHATGGAGLALAEPPSPPTG